MVTDHTTMLGDQILKRCLKSLKGYGSQNTVYRIGVECPQHSPQIVQRSYKSP